MTGTVEHGAVSSGLFLIVCWPSSKRWTQPQSKSPKQRLLSNHSQQSDSIPVGQLEKINSQRTTTSAYTTGADAEIDTLLIVHWQGISFRAQFLPVDFDFKPNLMQTLEHFSVR